MKTLFKTFFAAFIAIVSLTMFSACDDDVLGGMEWSISNSNPTDIKVQNDGSAQISITLGNEGGEVIFTCTNYDNLKMLLWDDKEESYYEGETGTFSVNGNKVTCSFPTVESIEENEVDMLKITAKNGKKTLNTILMVNRD